MTKKQPISLVKIGAKFITKFSRMNPTIYKKDDAS